NGPYERQDETKYTRSQNNPQRTRSTTHTIPPSNQSRASYLPNASACINCFWNGKQTRAQTDALHQPRVSSPRFQRQIAHGRFATRRTSQLGYTSLQPHARLSNCFHRTNVPREWSLPCPDYVRAPVPSLVHAAPFFFLWTSAALMLRAASSPTLRESR